MLPQQGHRHSEAVWAGENSELSSEDPGGLTGSRGDRMSYTSVELRGRESKELGTRLLRVPCLVVPGVWLSLRSQSPLLPLSWCCAVICLIYGVHRKHPQRLSAS